VPHGGERFSRYRFVTINQKMCSYTFFDEEGRPSFNALQNFGSSSVPVVYYVFDVMVLRGRDVRGEPLHKRRELFEKKVLPLLPEPVRYSAPLDADLPVLIQSVKAHGFEGWWPSG
jgi:bifunctional non-homologous end joining protein LigD